MLDRLEVPNPLARLSLEGKETISKQIVSHPIGSIEVKSSRTRRNEYQTSFFIEAYPAPTVGSPTILPGVPGPGVVTQLAGVRDGVKGPAKSARANVIGADVSRS